MNCGSRFARCGVLAALMFVSAAVPAAGVYKWVDQSGKVHYGEAPPTEAPRSEGRVHVPSAPVEPAAPLADRDERGNCQTIQCLADQMERERLARERKYAERRAENEREARKPPANKPEPLSGVDKQLQENCRNGLFYGSNSRVDCNDLKTLRQQWEVHRLQQDAARAELLRRGDWDRALRGR